MKILNIYGMEWIREGRHDMLNSNDIKCSSMKTVQLLFLLSLGIIKHHSKGDNENNEYSHFYLTDIKKKMGH